MGSLTHAILTMQMIDMAMTKDQGASYRGWLGRVLPHIGDAYRTDEDGFRSHLGASLVGAECKRSTWMKFRWFTRPKFDGRLLRLFNRGHLEEGRIIAALLMIGVQVYQQDENGKQFRISGAEGHYGGSGDGKAIGLPDAPPNLELLLEFKTHGESSFVKLAGKLPEWREYVKDPTRNPFTGQGVAEAKPEHYAQMQQYMHKMRITAALYVAVNKNTDDLYMEIVFYNPEFAAQICDLGESMVWMREPPRKINPSAGFFLCRFCDERPVCHLGEKPELNCRTCTFSEPVADAKWHCRKHDMELTKEKQLVGCPTWESLL